MHLPASENAPAAVVLGSVRFDGESLLINDVHPSLFSKQTLCMKMVGFVTLLGGGPSLVSASPECTALANHSYPRAALALILGIYLELKGDLRGVTLPLSSRWCSLTLDDALDTFRIR